MLTFDRILAPGNGYTGGHSWTQDYTGNSPASSAVMYQITDPVNNTGKSFPLPNAAFLTLYRSL